MRRAGRLREWARAVALLAVGVVVSLLLLEGGLRVLGVQPPFLYELREDVCAIHVPNLRVLVPGPERAIEASFNSAGYRDNERLLAKAPGSFRVALLGDSFVEALQVPFPETAGQVLERDLGDGNVEVLNFGSAGFGTACSYLTLRNRALGYAPDVVVLAFYVGNDVYDNHPQLAVEPDNAFFEAADDGSLRVRPVTVHDGPVRRWLRRHSRLAVFVRDRMKKMAGVQRLVVTTGLMRPAITPEEERARMSDRRVNSIFLRTQSALIDEAWALTERALREFADEVRRGGARVVVAIVPTAEQFDAAAARDYLHALGVGRDEVDFALPQRRLRAALTTADVPYVDLLDVFRGSGREADELYFAGDRHWTGTGNRVAGEAIADFLRAHVPGTPGASRQVRSAESARSGG